jgi:hypothetical protein
MVSCDYSIASNFSIAHFLSLSDFSYSFSRKQDIGKNPTILDLKHKIC